MIFENFEEAERFGLVMRILLPALWVFLAIASWNKAKPVLDSLWHLFYNVQYLRFIALINCSQSDYILEFWRNINRSIQQYSRSSDEVHSLHEQFGKVGISSPLFLDNTFVLLSLFLLYESVLAICYKKLTKDIELKTHIFSAMIKGVLVVYYDFWIFGVLQIQNIKVETVYQIFNLSIACSFLLFLLFFFMFAIFSLMKNTPTEQVLGARYTDCLTREFQREDGNFGHYLYYLIFILNRLIAGSILILLWEYPNIQNFVLILCQLTTCMYIMMLKPFQYKFLNCMAICVQALSLALLVCNMAYSHEAASEIASVLNGTNMVVFLTIILICLTKFSVCFLRHSEIESINSRLNKRGKQELQNLPSIDEGAENDKSQTLNMSGSYKFSVIRQTNESCRSSICSSTEEQGHSFSDEKESRVPFPRFFKSKLNPGSIS